MDHHNCLEHVLTPTEAARIWPIAAETLKKRCQEDRWLPGEIRKAGTVWLITRAALTRVYGEPPERVT